jgi:ankyrin repeat protein
MGLSKADIERRIRALVGNPLFEAARLDDVELMKAALASGRSLNERRPESGFTPLHTAALNGSNRFLKEALQRRRSRSVSIHELKSQMAAPLGPPEADPWIRDNKGMLPIDHAEVRRDREAMGMLYDAMYPDGRVPFTE